MTDTEKHSFSTGGGKGAPPTLWDPLVRIIHWSIAIAVLSNGLLNRPGGTAHVWIGWTVLVLLSVRFVWGLVGTREARFTSFPPRPKAAINHLKELRDGHPPEYRSHNPAGAMMIYALWAGLAIVVLTGLVMTNGKSPITIAEENAAVAAGDWSTIGADSNSGDGEDREHDEHGVVGLIHSFTANLVMILALIHIAGVALEWRVTGRNLVKPMLLGDRRR